jgi:hypothetical protein
MEPHYEFSEKGTALPYSQRQQHRINSNKGRVDSSVTSALRYYSKFIKVTLGHEMIRNENQRVMTNNLLYSIVYSNSPGQCSTMTHSILRLTPIKNMSLLTSLPHTSSPRSSPLLLPPYETPVITANG